MSLVYAINAVKPALASYTAPSIGYMRLLRPPYYTVCCCTIPVFCIYARNKIYIESRKNINGKLSQKSFIIQYTVKSIGHKISVPDWVLRTVNKIKQEILLSYVYPVDKLMSH